MVTLTGLFIYPVKSARGIALREAMLGDRGLVNDRRFMVVDAAGQMLTQRDAPLLARLVTAIDGDALRLSCDGQVVTVPLHPREGARRMVRVWRDEVEALDLGDDANALVAGLLRRPARLVYMPDHTHRQVDPTYASPHDLVGFADGYPYLLTNEGSLAALNAVLPERVGMERFRPNLVIAGAPAYAEDGYRELRIGLVRFEALKPCTRCVIINTDQVTGEREQGTLEGLSRTHLIDRRVVFGQNLVARDGGVVRVGDPVTLPPPS